MAHDLDKLNDHIFRDQVATLEENLFKKYLAQAKKQIKQIETALGRQGSRRADIAPSLIRRYEGAKSLLQAKLNNTNQTEEDLF